MATNTKIRAIITGASGMVGEGVMQECLVNPNVEAVLVIGRRACGTTHPKLKEVIHSDFFNLTAIESQLSGYNVCYFCLGTSSVGMNEVDYTKVTHTLTLNFAQTVCKLNPDMTFCYVSGSGTDSTEKGNIMWARVKGKTENDLMKLPFKKTPTAVAVYAFRPGFMKATAGAKNTLAGYKYASWIYPIGRSLFPKFFCTLTEVGKAMINLALYGFEKQIIDVVDIVTLAGK